jgi:hypothetical protein
MDANLPLWVTVVIAIGTLIGGSFGKTILEGVFSKKQSDRADEELKHKFGIETNLQALKIYQDLVLEFKSDLAKVTENMEALQKEHLQCQKDNASLLAKVEIQEVRIRGLESKG